MKLDSRRLTADLLTPVGIYLRLRDMYSQSLLLECGDHSLRSNAMSYICIKPFRGVEVLPEGTFYWCLQHRERMGDAAFALQAMDSLVGDAAGDTPSVFGFTSFDAVNLFDTVGIRMPSAGDVPLLKYDQYQVVLAYNHVTGTLSVNEQRLDNEPSILDAVVGRLKGFGFAEHAFRLEGDEATTTSDADYMALVERGKQMCALGEVFQVVLSRRFSQRYAGDELNVYRALRAINPSPYLFFFDYAGYKLMGSSPEAQLRVSGGVAQINPIAGTAKKTGNAVADAQTVSQLLSDAKETSEHAMLVDLARNDLSRQCRDVRVEQYRDVHSYSHLFHLVSTVSGKLNAGISSYAMLAASFPAGTLSGAPKHRAVRLIDELEPHNRGFYGGAIGFIGANGLLNHAIMIRSICCRAGVATYQAGAGVVIGSTPTGELNEVNHKIAALRQALHDAQHIA